MCALSAAAKESERWRGYYATQVGRATRPLFDEALRHYVPVQSSGRRLAVELGCGDGTESLALLAHGWCVLAVDKQAQAIELLRARVLPEHLDRLETQVAGFEAVVVPPCQLIYAGYSLPFTEPIHFSAVWAGVVRALRPGGIFVGQFFGDRDTWTRDPSMTFQTRGQALALLAPLAIDVFREREEDGPAFSGPKHWHIFDIIARRFDA